MSANRQWDTDGLLPDHIALTSDDDLSADEATNTEPIHDTPSMDAVLDLAGLGHGTPGYGYYIDPCSPYDLIYRFCVEYDGEVPENWSFLRFTISVENFLEAGYHQYTHIKRIQPDWNVRPNFKLKNMYQRQVRAIKGGTRLFLGEMEQSQSSKLFDYASGTGKNQRQHTDHEQMNESNKDWVRKGCF